MISHETAMEYVREYAASRLRDPSMMSWVGGSLALLTTLYATSSGRQLAKAMPPPRLRRIQSTIVNGNAETMTRSEANASPVPPSGPSSPSSPLTRAATLPSAAEVAAVLTEDDTSREASVFHHFLQLLGIAVPNFYGREARSIYILFVLMLARAYTSMRMVNSSGLVTRTAIEGNLKRVVESLLLFGASCVPATLLNVTLDYYAALLELHFRENMSNFLSDRYLKRRVFFQLAGLHAVDHVDQRITEDVRNWARVSAALFTNIPRPLIEALMFSIMLARQGGWKATSLTWSYYLTFALWIVACAPNLDWMVEQQMEKEGKVRAAHQSLLAHAEEITLTKGFPYYEELLQRLSKAVTNQSRYAAYVRARFNVSEILYTKYGSVLLGYIVCAMAAMRPKASGITPEDATGSLTRASYTFKTLASAIGRFLWNIKLLFIVGGYTRRLAQFVTALKRADQLVQLQTDRTSHSPTLRQAPRSFSSLLRNESFVVSCNDTFGRIVRGEHIEFVDVPLVLPTGECLCRSMSFHVQPGMNLLIIGPNGCGKSSTFRLLGELWPLRGGRIVKPEAEQLYYVPQRPYMYDGTLLEQVIYPLKKKDLTVGEAELYHYLQMVGLEYVFTKSNMSWETRLSWNDDTLSLGEQQRLAMARLFFHRPRFAILDECSSLIDLDVERQMYDYCVELGITVITIAHRRSVWKYHNWILYFDGNGGYMFSPLHYDAAGAALVLTEVRSASDASQIGKEVLVPVTDRLYSEKEDVPEGGPGIHQHVEQAAQVFTEEKESAIASEHTVEEVKMGTEQPGPGILNKSPRHRRSRHRHGRGAATTTTNPDNNSAAEDVSANS